MTALAQLMSSDPASGDPCLPGTAGGRDPAHVLYEHAATMLETTQALEAATHAPGAVAAVAPTLACLETSLAALASAAGRLRSHALERFSDPRLAADDRRPRRADVALQLERLAGVLEHGSLVSRRAQASLEPVLHELTAI